MARNEDGTAGLHLLDDQWQRQQEKVCRVNLVAELALTCVGMRFVLGAAKIPRR
jgi:hypothetical protein